MFKFRYNYHPIGTYGSFIYTHIPKCGGTSFRSFINDAAIKSGVPIDEIYIPGLNELHYAKNLNQLEELDFIELRKQKIKVLANHSMYNEHAEYKLELDNPFYYTIFRDPVERFVSHYNFFYFKEGMDNCKDITLNELPETKLIELVKQLANIQVHYISNIKHSKLVGMENVFKVACYNLTYEYNSFGILERMDDSVKKLSADTPEWIIFNDEFPSLNTYKAPSKIEPHIIDLIKRENEWDVKLYELAIKLF